MHHEALDLTKDRSEWRDCTARCASTTREGLRSKVRIIHTIIITRQFIRHRNMSIKSLLGHPTITVPLYGNLCMAPFRFSPPFSSLL